MMIAFKCSHCGKTLRVDDKYAGQQGTCTQCKNPVTAPLPLPTDADMAFDTPRPKVKPIPSIADADGISKPKAAAAALLIAGASFVAGMEFKKYQIRSAFQDVAQTVQGALSTMPRFEMPDIPAPTPARFTLDQFNRIQQGMSYAQVVQILGEEGKQESASSGSWPGGTIRTDTKYKWHGSSYFDGITCSFDNDALTYKSQIGLQ